MTCIRVALRTGAALGVDGMIEPGADDRDLGMATDASFTGNLSPLHLARERRVAAKMGGDFAEGDHLMFELSDGTGIDVTLDAGDVFV